MVTKAEFREVVASRSEGRILDLLGRASLASPAAQRGASPAQRSPKADAGAHLRVVSVLLDDEELSILQQARQHLGLP